MRSVSFSISFRFWPSNCDGDYATLFAVRHVALCCTKQLWYVARQKRILQKDYKQMHVPAVHDANKCKDVLFWNKWFHKASEKHLFLVCDFEGTSVFHNKTCHSAKERTKNTLGKWDRIRPDLCNDKYWLYQLAAMLLQELGHYATLFAVRDVAHSFVLIKHDSC